MNPFDIVIAESTGDFNVLLLAAVTSNVDDQRHSLAWSVPLLYSLWQVACGPQLDSRTSLGQVDGLWSLGGDESDCRVFLKYPFDSRHGQPS